MNLPKIIKKTIQIKENLKKKLLPLIPLIKKAKKSHWFLIAVALAIILNGFLFFKFISSRKENQLKLSPAPISTSYLYQSIKKDYKVYLGSRSAKEMPQIKMAVGESSIDFVPEETVSDKTRFSKQDEKSVVYKNVYPGIDFAYTLIKDGVKEEIKINSLQDFSSLKEGLTFKLNLKNALPQKDLMGHLTSTFVDPTSGNYLFHFEKPFMIDAGNNKSYQVKMEILTYDGQNYGIRLEPDQNWLTSALFPVIIDPTVVHNEQSDFTSGQFNRVKDNGNWATGGTITYSGDYTIHTFTSSGTFIPSGTGNVEVLVVAGGGGGGTTGGYGNNYGGGGGGGAGGLIYNAAKAVTAENSYTVTVGLGGNAGLIGNNSVFSDLTAIGGGAGGSTTGGNGGSGGGGAGGSTVAYNGGSGQAGQGYGGGNGYCWVSMYSAGGGGGGAGGAGQTAPTNGWAGGIGGIGLEYDISGTPVTYAVGGDGREGLTTITGYDGTVNRGNGGGAGEVNPGGKGGSGIVIVRYPTSYIAPLIELYEQELTADLNTVGLWHMNESSGTTTVADSSGNGNTGTSASSTNVGNGKLSNARTFNGSSDKITTTLDFSKTASQPLSMSAWINISSLSDHRPIFGKSDANWEYNFEVNTSGNVVFAYYTTSGTHGTSPGPATGPSAITTNQWYHVAVSFNGSSGNVYVNGIPGPQFVSTGTWQDRSNTLTIGYTGYELYTGLAKYFAGSIDEAAVYNRALSSEEIKAHAQKRPYGVYTSPSLDLGTSVASLDSLQWTESITPPSTPDGWTKVKPVIIDNSQNSNTLTDYQIKLTVPYDSNMQSDFDDLRFTNSSGTNLDYWIESKSDGVEATVWVEVNSIPASSKNTIFMFYGNSGASAGSNGGDTFSTFFYDFTGTTIDTAKLDYGGGTITQNEYLSIVNNVDAWDEYVYTDSTFTRSAYRTFYTRFKADSGTRSMIGWHDSGTGVSYTDLVHALYFNNGTFDVYEDGASRALSGKNYTVGVWHDVKIELESTGAKYYYKLLASPQWILLYDGSYSSESNLRPAMVHYDVTEYSHTDNWFVLNSTSPEPTVGLGADIEFQTRTSANGTTWEEWKPTGVGSTAIDSMDSVSSWNIRDSSLYSGIPISTAPEATIKIEGTGSMKNTVGTPLVDANTKALWHFDETSVGTGSTAYDSSGNNYHGTATGTTLSDGFYGKGRNFNGSSDVISIPGASIPTGNQISISFWTYGSSSLPANNSIIEGNDASGNRVINIHLAWSDGNIYWDAGNSGTSSYDRINKAASASEYKGRWAYWTFTKNVSTGSLKIYLDGNLWHSGTGLTRTLSAVTTAKIGSNSGSTVYYPGKIDEFKIDSVELTAEQIAEAYRAGRDHRVEKTLSSSDLSSKNKIPFYVATDRPGDYLETYIGETSHSIHQTDANTVGLWHLDEKSGSGAYLKDASGNGNHGTPTGTVFTQGKIGGALKFNNGSSNVNINNNFTTLGNYTMAAWVFPTGNHVNYTGSIISSGDWNTNHWAFGLNQTNTGIDLRRYDSISYANQAYSFPLNTWSYVTITRNGTQANFYVNGQYLGTATGSSTNNLVSSVSNTMIGRETYASGYFGFNGNIDEVRIDNIVRTADEIRQAYQYGLRTHQITVDYVTTAGSDGPTSTSDLSFTPDSVSGLYVGDTVIAREKVGETTYIAQGEVTSISSGTVTVSSWSGTAPPSVGFSTNADVFKWQREYWDITDISTGDRDAITKLGIRVLDATEGFDAYFDDFRDNQSYLTDPEGEESITSTPQRYFQYRAILSTNDTTVSPSLTSVTLNYTINNPPSAPDSLLTEGETNPLGVDDITPEFSAVYNDLDVGDTANKYRIQVATDLDFIGGDPIVPLDNADTVANWTSSDDTYFAKSQDTSDKEEGTGSIKVTAVEPDTGAYEFDDHYVKVFTSTPGGGTWTVPFGVEDVDVLVVAGGGGGTSSGFCGTGGGGAGGLIYETDYEVDGGEEISVTIGDGGAGNSSIDAAGGSGSDSVFDTLTSIGGGGGGGGYEAAPSGGSGGGAGAKDSAQTKGTGQQPASEDGGFGNDGGTGASSSDVSTRAGGGGGGAGGAGGNAAGNNPGGGGVGKDYSAVFGTGYGEGGYFAGGGAGISPGGPTDSGGTGGGGNSATGSNGESGQANTGGGGGATDLGAGSGGNGGSGIVIVRWPKATFSNETLTRDLGAGNEKDLSELHNIKFSIKSSRTGTYLQFGFGETAWDDNTSNITINTADEWEEKSIDISGITNVDKNAVRYLGFKTTNIDDDFIMKFDDIKALPQEGTNSIIWDSGESGTAMSDCYQEERCSDISYDGTGLASAVTYYWRIKYWDDEPSEGDWSTETAYFTINSAPSEPTSLQVEVQTNPTGVTDTTPEFSAVYNDYDSSDIADKYRIQVDDNPAFGSALWDSGASGTAMSNCNQGDRCSEISYGGVATDLQWGAKYYWRIKYWDDGGWEGDWSTETAYFTMSPIYEPTSCMIDDSNHPEQTIFKWADNTNLETGYRIERSVDDSSWTLLSTETINTTSKIDSTTEADATYKYRVRANSDNGNSMWCQTETVNYGKGTFYFQ